MVTNRDDVVGAVWGMPHLDKTGKAFCELVLQQIVLYQHTMLEGAVQCLLPPTLCCICSCRSPAIEQQGVC